MGEMYIAKCLNCGYKTGMLTLGGGMLNFDTYDGEPVCNFDTKEIEVANAKEREKIMKDNPNIAFYFHDQKLYREHDEHTIDAGEEHGIIELKDRKLYLCPKCNEFKLVFLWQGMWD